MCGNSPKSILKKEKLSSKIQRKPSVRNEDQWGENPASLKELERKILARQIP